MREDALRYRTETDLKLYEDSVNLSKEVASLLRKNFVQAKRQAGEDTWSTHYFFHISFT